jgi:cytochrome P450
MTKRIPGPRGNWLLGNLTEFRSGMLPFFERCRREFGTVVKFRLGPRKLLLISDPALIEKVLVTQNKSFKKHFGTRLLKPVLGKGLILNEGKDWLKQRKLIQPAFSRKFTDEFSRIVTRHTTDLANHWLKSPRRDLYHDMTQLTVRIAADAFLGIRNTEQMEEIGEHLEVIHADFEYRFQRAMNLPTCFPTSRNLRLRKSVRGLTSIIDRMIDLRQLDAKEHQDALSLLLCARDERGERMPRQLLRDEVMTLLLAGHDTTANGLTWTWSLLAEHPEVLHRLQHELEDPGLTQREGSDAMLAEQIIKESMRLYPPVYMFGREATCSLSLDETPVRKGDSVVMSQWVVHRDARYFPDPEEFKPERWTTDFERSLPKYAYFPFGGGPRVCIGKQMAMLEAVGVLAILAKKFSLSLESPQDVQPWPTVTLRPKGPVWATVRKVESFREQTAGLSNSISTIERS